MASVDWAGVLRRWTAGYQLLTSNEVVTYFEPRALDALGPQRESLILVGVQAIYLHTGEADIAVAPAPSISGHSRSTTGRGASPAARAIPFSTRA